MGNRPLCLKGIHPVNVNHGVFHAPGHSDTGTERRVNGRKHAGKSRIRPLRPQAHDNCIKGATNFAGYLAQDWAEGPAAAAASAPELRQGEVPRDSVGARIRHGT